MPLEADDFTDLAKTPAGGTVAAGSVTARSAGDVIKLDDRARALEAVEGTNDNGGPKSAWHCLRIARASLPGAR